jgi:hypothetical protein
MWGFGNITNNSQQVLMFDYAVAAGSTPQGGGGALNNTRGDAILEIGSLGAIYLTDVGHQGGGPHYWCVQIAWNANTANWYYDGGGALDVVVNADGSFALSGQGQTIAGNINDSELAGPPLAAASASVGAHAVPKIAEVKR